MIVALLTKETQQRFVVCIFFFMANQEYGEELTNRISTPLGIPF